MQKKLVALVMAVGIAMANTGGNVAIADTISNAQFAVAGDNARQARAIEERVYADQYRHYAALTAGRPAGSAVAPTVAAAYAQEMAERHLPTGLTAVADGWEPPAEKPDAVIARRAYAGANGERHVFSAWVTTRVRRPLAWVAAGFAARPSASHSEAEAFLRQQILNAPKGGSYALRMSALPVGTNACVKGAFSGHVRVSPFERAYVAFVDDDPFANWGHACRYVFIKDDLSAFAVLYASEPMSVESAGGEVELKALEDTRPPADPAGLKKAQLAVNSLNFNPPACRNGDTSHSYAVLISGGYNSSNNHTRYWGDTAAVYSLLTRRYGIPRENVQVFMSDGTSAGQDISTHSSSHSYFLGRTSPLDLDCDGTGDVTGSATASSLRQAFADLKSKLTANDQLFVFVTDHGDQDDAGDCYVCLWNSTKMSVTDFAALTDGLSCPVVFALEFCYSGGFAEALTSQGGVRVVASAASVETSSAWSRTSRVTGVTSSAGLPYMDPWVYYFVGAAGGWFPSVSLSPWNETSSYAEADGNGDRLISVAEASAYAKAKVEADGYDETPAYAESAADVGDSLYLVKGTPSLGGGELLYLSVSGASTVGGGQTADYSCKAFYGNASSAAVSPTWSVDVGSDVASINANGRLTVVENLLTNAIVTVRADYAVGGVSRRGVWKTVAKKGPPPNDNFANAEAIAGASGTLTASSEGATTESGEPLVSYKSSAAASVWWVWTAPANGSVQIDTIGSGFDTLLGVYTGTTLAGLATVAQDDDSGTSRTSKCVFTCTSGTRYYIAVAGWSGATGTVKLNWNLTADEPEPEPIVGTTSLYVVVDLSGGPTASSYPVTGLDDVPAGGWTDEHKTTKLVLRRIDPGTFTMGCATGQSFALPQVRVTFTNSFYAGVFCITQRQWELIMGTRPSYFENTICYATRPVETVSWNQIRGSGTVADWPNSRAVTDSSFVGILRRRTGLTFDLPTEAQWEYACRAGTTTELNSGKTATTENMAEVGRCGTGSTPTVVAGVNLTAGTPGTGSYAPNNWGLYDMHGNIGEWCLDYYQVRDDYPTAAVTDPVGAASGTFRVLRGGSWYFSPGGCASHARNYTYPSTAYWSYGLRIFCSAAGMDDASGRLAAPTGVTASDGASSASVAISWNAVEGATSYTVWRGTSNNPAQAVKIATVSTTSYSDATPSYYAVCYYWVKAVNDSGSSTFSASDSGYRYQENTHLLKYDANGGTGTMADQVRPTSYASYLTKNAFSRSGYAFMGWATTPTGSRRYTEGEYARVSTVAGAIVTLYAVWGACDADGFVIEGHVVKGWTPVRGTSIAIPEGVTSIAAYAFRGSSVTSVVFPDSLTAIGSAAFEDCVSLADITFGTGLLTVGSSAFCGCTSLEGTFVVPEGVTEIECATFTDTGLTELVFPTTLRELDYQIGLFTDIADIWFKGNAPTTPTIRSAAYPGESSPFYYMSDDLVFHVAAGTTGWKDATTDLPTLWPADYTQHSIVNYTGNPPVGTCTHVRGTTSPSDFLYKLVNGNAIITNYVGTSGDVVFPATLDGHPVTEIAEIAFYYDDYPFVHVTISEGIQKIGHAAFGYSTLMETISIPSTVTVLGDSDGADFLACPKLRRVDVADGNPNYKSVDGVLYNKSGTTLIYCPASKSPGETFVVPSTVTYVAEYAFCSSAFRSVTLPSSLTQIEDNVFWCASGLETMDIPASVTSIGRWAFCYCTSLSSIKLPAHLTGIGQFALVQTKLKVLDIPSEVTAIGEGALNSCSTITNLTLRGRVATTYASNKWGSNLANSKIWVKRADFEYWQDCFGTGINVLDPGELLSVSVYGADSVYAGMTATYVCTAAYSSGISGVVTPTWSIESGSSYATISASGVLTTTAATTSRSVTIKASHTEGGVTKTATKTVTIKPSLTLGASVDATELTFTTGGSAEWFGQDAETHDGTDATRSGAIGDSQSTWMKTTVTGPGTISFWWYVSSESVLYDYLAFSVDGVQKDKIGGTSGGWTQRSYQLAAGTHELTWTYRKDGSLSGGLDAGFVDQVEWTPCSISSVIEFVGSTGGREYLLIPAGEGMPFAIPATWLAETGIDVSGGVTAALLAGNGRNGIPRYKSFLLGLDPESATPAAEQFRTTLTMGDDGMPVVSCEPRRDSDLIAYTVLGKPSLDSAQWVEVTDANRASMRFFKVQVDVQ